MEIGIRNMERLVLWGLVDVEFGGYVSGGLR